VRLRHWLRIWLGLWLNRDGRWLSLHGWLGSGFRAGFRAGCGRLLRSWVRRRLGGNVNRNIEGHICRGVNWGVGRQRRLKHNQVINQNRATVTLVHTGVMLQILEF
jgi:hypothetical protein